MDWLLVKVFIFVKIKMKAIETEIFDGKFGKAEQFTYRRIS